MRSKSSPLRRSLWASLWEGIFASIFVGLTDQFFVPLALLLKATNQAIGLLVAIPNFMAALAQAWSVKVVTFIHSRKKVMVKSVFLQALLVLPIAVLPYLRLPAKPYLLIFLITIYAMTGAFSAPPYGSIMSDYIPAHKRGRFFGWRNRIFGLVIVGSSLAAGIFLRLFQPANPFIGFTILFFLAFLFRLGSGYNLMRMKEFTTRFSEKYQFTFWMFIRRIRESNFVKFGLFVSLITFGANVAGPFFSVFMLRDLGFNYLTYVLINITALITLFGSMKLWGHHADLVGNLHIMRLTSIFIVIVPLWWVFMDKPIHLILIQIIGGFVWGGFNLAASNFIYDAVTPEKRVRCIAYFNMMNGIALSLGAILGGFLASRLPPLMGYQLRGLFGLSAFLRLLPIVLLLPLIKEVRPIRKTRSLDLFFSVIGLRPLLGLSRETTLKLLRR